MDGDNEALEKGADEMTFGKEGSWWGGGRLTLSTTSPPGPTLFFIVIH